MKHYSTREAADILDTSEAQVRTYARLGPIAATPGELEFSFQQLLLLKTTKGLLDAGVPARRVQRMWASLRRQLTADEPLTSITLSADGHDAVASDGRARWRPESGQFLLPLEGDVEPDAGGPEATAPREPAALAETRSEQHADPAQRDEPPPTATAARITRLVPPDRAARRAAPTRTPLSRTTEVPPPRSEASGDRDTAEHWFQVACDLETASPLEACAAYLRALEIEPAFADAHVNLGRLFHGLGELGKAEAHYREALRLDASDATSHFNLGVLLQDRGRPEEAIHAYEQALLRDPDAADAHYNLGLLLESRRRRPEAMRHLMTARQLYEQQDE